MAARPVRARTGCGTWRRHDLPVVVVCNEGYASTLAAASLHALGLHRATDLAGGFQAWRAAGLPVTPPDGIPTRADPAPRIG